MASVPPPIAPPPREIRWHRHWVILIRAIGAPVAGTLALIFVPLLTGGLKSTGTTLAFLVGSVVLIFEALRASRGVPAPEGRAPLSQLERALYRVATPVRYIMVGSAVVLAIVTFGLSALSLFRPSFEMYLTIVYVVWFLALGFWLVFNTIDWRNDVYILTPDRIIDQVKFPLLYEQRTEARLDQVQNVRVAQGFAGGLLGYGNITVETAGRTQAVVFYQVPRPVQIQRTIFARIGELNERRGQQEADARQQELLRWFTGYHALTGRIELQPLPESVGFQRTVRPDWRVNVSPDTRYETWVTYDGISHATDNQYAQSTPHHSGQGRANYREFIPARHRGFLYLKVWLRTYPPNGSDAQPEIFATREENIRIV